MQTSTLKSKSKIRALTKYLIIFFVIIAGVALIYSFSLEKKQQTQQKQTLEDTKQNFSVIITQINQLKILDQRIDQLAANDPQIVALNEKQVNLLEGLIDNCEANREQLEKNPGSSLREPFTAFYSRTEQAYSKYLAFVEYFFHLNQALNQLQQAPGQELTEEAYQELLKETAQIIQNLQPPQELKAFHEQLLKPEETTEEETVPPTTQAVEQLYTDLFNELNQVSQQAQIVKQQLNQELLANKIPPLEDNIETWQ